MMKLFWKLRARSQTWIYIVSVGSVWLVGGLKVSLPAGPSQTGFQLPTVVLLHVEINLDLSGDNS